MNSCHASDEGGNTAYQQESNHHSDKWNEKDPTTGSHNIGNERHVGFGRNVQNEEAVMMRREFKVVDCGVWDTNKPARARLAI